MSLEMHCCVPVGRDDAMNSPHSPLKKNATAKRPTPFELQEAQPQHGVSWFTRSLRRLEQCLQNGIPLPTFPGVMRN